MKKIVLITFLSVGAFNGMELERTGMEDLPSEVKRLILMYVYESDNLEDVIYNVKKASVINTELYNIINEIKGFTALVHMLADKFGMTTVEVAKEFNMPIAEKYLKLGYELFDAAESSYKSKYRMGRLIAEGADINFSDTYNTPLKKALTNSNNEGIQILLKFGVKRTNEDVVSIKAIGKLHPPKE